MMIIQEFVFEMQHGMNGFDHSAFLRGLSSSKNKGLRGDLNPDLCDAGALLYKLSHQAIWEEVVVV